MLALAHHTAPHQNPAAPHAILRSSLFSSIDFGKTARAVFTKPTQLGHSGAAKVMQCAGQQLDQADADVYLALLRNALNQPQSGEDVIRIVVKANSLLAEIGRSAGGSDRKWLRESLARLKRASFLFEIPGLIEVEWSLVASLVTDTWHTYQVEINRNTAALLNNGYSFIAIDVRKKLKADPLARFLHAFYCTHASPWPMTIETIQKISGRESQRSDRFLKVLTTSISNLSNVTGWKIEVDDGKLIVKKKERAPRKSAPGSQDFDLTTPEGREGYVRQHLSIDAWQYRLPILLSQGHPIDDLLSEYADTLPQAVAEWNRLAAATKKFESEDRARRDARLAAAPPAPVFDLADFAGGGDTSAESTRTVSESYD